MSNNEQINKPTGHGLKGIHLRGALRSTMHLGRVCTPLADTRFVPLLIFPVPITSRILHRYGILPTLLPESRRRIVAY